MITNERTAMEVKQFVETHLTVRVENPSEPSRCLERVFRIDVVSTDSLVSRRGLESIGLFSQGERVYQLPDGKESPFAITGAQMELVGEMVGATIRIGDNNSEPVLGLTALASAGIEKDPVTGALYLRRAGRLQGGFNPKGPVEPA